MNKKTLGIALGVVVVAALVGYGVSQMSPRITSVLAPQAQIGNPSLSATETPPHDPTVAVQEVIPGSSNISVAWANPTITTSLGVVTNPAASSETKYYKVGTFTSGDYKGDDVVRVTVPPTGMGGDSVYYFVGHSPKAVLLAKDSYELYDGDFLNRAKFVVDKSTVLPNLTFPSKMLHKGDSFNLETSLMFTVNNGFFNETYAPADLKVAFVHPELGTVYMDTPGEKTSKGVYKQHGFYLKAPDGTLRAYSLDLPFFKKDSMVPQVVWNDGATNKVEYSYTDRGGCGSRDYAAVVYGVTTNDLVAAGKTSGGDIVYELKNSKSAILDTIYKNDYNPYNAPKISYSAFVQSKPVFFWYDSFGRLIKFQKSEFLPQAECGKPVIYLYPEKTTNVSVKVTPKGGFTKTIPDYNNGWNVVATPESVLTEVSTRETYPYLFWEGRGGIYTTPQKGFVVAANDVHRFLVEKLTKLGLNQKEQADFIEFWEPRMTGAPYFFVTFLGNREMDAIAPLTIVPKPDSVIRVLMDFSPLSTPIVVEGYDIQTPKRNGFTVVEWGGVLR